MALLAAGLLAALPISAGAGPIVAFGDSLTDTGNVFTATQGEIPASPPYFEGRFTNGPIYLDYIAEVFNTEVEPSLAGGTNFAFGGARIETPSPSAPVPSLRAQADLFLAGLPPSGRTDASALHVVFGGSDDVRDALLLGSAADSVAAVTDAATSLAAIVADLAAAGAKKFLVPNLPNLGRIPEVRLAGSGVAEQADALSQAFNESLATALEELRQDRPVKLVLLDVYTILEDIIADPGAFGFTNVTEPCLTEAGICENPDQYVFWDQLHATTAVHALYAEAALAALRGGKRIAVPEPNGLALLVVGLLGLTVAVRRSRRPRSDGTGA